MLANSVGAMTGAAGAIVAASAWHAHLRHRIPSRFVNAESGYPLIVSGALAFAGALAPFDVTLDVPVVLGHAKSLFTPDAWVWSRSAPPVFRALLLAYMICRFLSDAAVRRPLRWGVVVAIASLTLLEFGQLFVESGSPAVSDLGVQTAGAIAGGAFFAVGSVMGRDRLMMRLVIAGAIAAAVVDGVYPFQLAARVTAINWLPFRPFYESATPATVGALVETVLLYFPIGFSGVWRQPPTRRPAVGVLLLAAGVAAAIEWAQQWMPGRFPDVTDVLLAFFGTLLGVMVARAAPAEGLRRQSRR